MLLNNNNKRCIDESNIKYKKQKVNRDDCRINCKIYLNSYKVTECFEVYLEKKYFIKNDLYAIYNVISDLFPTNNWSDMIIEKIEYIGNKNILYITVENIIDKY